MMQVICDFDERTKEVTVKKLIPINTSAAAAEFIEHRIQGGQAKYGILTLGKNAKKLGMTVGTEIIVEIDGNLMDKRFMTHKAVVGRIDGMTSVYAEGLLADNDLLHVSYDIDGRILRIEHV